MKKTHQKLIKGLQKFVKETGFNKAVVGLSGGIDSALTLKIAVDALGASQITALLLPELGLTARENIEHAEQLAHFLGVKTFKVPINTIASNFDATPWQGNALATMNTKARIRMSLLYHFANSHKALVLGTSNLSETLLGYGTKYGDLAADVEVIGALYKTQVYELAEHVGLPQEFIEKAPSAELSNGQTDESELGAPYQILDAILKMLESKKRVSTLEKKGFPKSLILDVQKRIETNTHKTKMPPVLPI